MLAILRKFEVQNAIMTSVELDRLAEENRLSQLLNVILTRDEELYGIDKILGLGVVNLYGFIGLTNYGYLDKVKSGVIKKMDSKLDKQCHTFLDDIVSAIAAASTSLIAYNEPDKDKLTQEKN